MNTRRELHIVSGNVQGVGFRPFVYTTAQKLSLTGFVQNTHEGVRIEVQGTSASLDSFCQHLQLSLPPLALIVSHRHEILEPVEHESGFIIRPSSGQVEHAVFIGPDTATCQQCLHDIFDPGNRRYLYPFTNCTNCGPRYSIIKSIPYDRNSTSMACFPLCQECHKEYTDPADRRFHAQPNACARCGAHVWYVTPGLTHADDTGMPHPVSADAIKKAAQLLHEEKILALKGLGGFHLACLASSEAAVHRLRQIKNRPHKPFALMAARLEDAEQIVRLSDKGRQLLQSPAHPIVLSPRRSKKYLLPLVIAPDTNLLGVMLAYTPLHHILFFELRKIVAQHQTAQPPVLVMTSGNRGGEPICLGNREALTRLQNMADAFLLHNRDILIRVDDSVVFPVTCPPRSGDRAQNRPQQVKDTGSAPDQETVITLRRARGYAPLPIPLPAPLHASPSVAQANQKQDSPCILGVGAELKNTICVNKGRNAFVSQHLGDMGHHEATLFHDEILEHLQSILMVKPSLAVHDKHPDYYTTRKAQGLGLPVMALQHHAAHAFSVLGENKITEKSLVLALDGTGYGDDKTLWGGEALMTDMRTGQYTRLGSFSPVPLPGGEAAIAEPWRIAHALCLTNEIDPTIFPWLPAQQATARFIPHMLEKHINTPTSTSCGRLFDAVAALLGLGMQTTYEGQAAILLEALALKSDEPGRILPCPFYTENGFHTLDTNTLFTAVCEEIEAGISPAAIALSFHQTLVTGLAIWAKSLCAAHNVRFVGLSGGCFNNQLLLAGLCSELKKLDLNPVIHQQLPCGDGCISYGQVVWGSIIARQYVEIEGQ